MGEVFNAMDNTLKTFWVIACVASLVFVIQTILTFIGLGEIGRASCRERV